MQINWSRMRWSWAAGLVACAVVPLASATGLSGSRQVTQREGNSVNRRLPGAVCFLAGNSFGTIPVPLSYDKCNTAPDPARAAGLHALDAVLAGSGQAAGRRGTSRLPVMIRTGWSS